MKLRKWKTVVRSCAKVNLTLDVLGSRPDGFHAIESVMQSVSLQDTVTLTLGGSPGIRVSCDMPGIPTDERNLAYAAAERLLADRRIEPALDIHITKLIPPEAGLGGGSSNAAAVLRGLASLLDAPPSDCLLLDLAAQIGSDVPFFLVGGTALVGGRGENLQRLPDIRPFWLVIVKPPFGVSTAWAYRRLDEMRHAGIGSTSEERVTASERMSEYIRMGSVQVTDCLSNDLELPALEAHPQIAQIKRALIDLGAKGSLMCGSGSAVFGVFDHESRAREAANNMPESAGRVFLARTLSREEALAERTIG